MADLFNRLFPENDEDPNISGHLFEAVLIEYMTGHVTKAQMIAYWGFDTTVQADLTVLLNKCDALTGAIDKLVFLKELSAVITMASQGLLYNTKSAFATRLGLN